MPKIAIIVDYDIAPGKEAEFNTLIREHARLTKEQEPGCIRFEVMEPFAHEGPDKGKKFPNRLVVSELYDGYDALEAHNNSPRVPPLRERFKVLLSGRRVILAETA